ncbi:MAG: SGNH/GDSL hydrolase family protein [Gammaproteobacteria bacterium]|nr:MAG: SGNH/GDSL hydrolase family protein [Gammaproteobacteria bacterium]
MGTLAVSNHLSLLGTTSAMGLLPLALAQSVWLRMVGRRLQEPFGERWGWTGDSAAEPLRLLVVGDSVALGVGCSAMERSLAPRLAYGLAVRLRRRVEWQVIGRRNWTAAEVLRHLVLNGTPRHDIGLVLLGANDALGLTARGRWRREFGRIFEQLELGGGRLLLSSGIRALGQVPAQPWPLNTLLGERFRQLDLDALDVVRTRRPDVDRTCLHVPIDASELRPHLKQDGFHPSAAGYAHWARWLSERVIEEWRALPQSLPGVEQAG